MIEDFLSAFGGTPALAVADAWADELSDEVEVEVDSFLLLLLLVVGLFSSPSVVVLGAFVFSFFLCVTVVEESPPITPSLVVGPLGEEEEEVTAAGTVASTGAPETDGGTLEDITRVCVWVGM